MTRHLAPTDMTTTTASDEFDEFDDFLQDKLSDPAFVAAFEDAAHRARIIGDLVKCRKAQKLKQKDVAAHMGVSQSVISEFENSEGDAYYSTLQRYARAIGARLAYKMELPADQTWASHVPSNYSQKGSAPTAERPVVRKPDNAYLNTWAKTSRMSSAA